MKKKPIKASSCKCCKCGKQAVCFWPCVDPDIKSHPYCRKCVDEAKNKLLMYLCNEDGLIGEEGLIGNA